MESDVKVAKSEGGVSGWRDFGFNLCVVPFPNIYVPNFKLERLMSELFGKGATHKYCKSSSVVVY